jgi:hypothetical protein
MASLDFETKLDEALRHLAEGKPDDAVHSMPEAADLIKVAQRIQLLKPAPEPRLAQGRERLLSEAARLRAPARARPSLLRLFPRPVLAFLTAFILLASGLVFVSMRESMRDWSNTPSPTVSPTLTGTPTNTAFGRIDSIPVVPTRSNQETGMSRPEPAPTPSPPRGRQPSVMMTILEWQLFNG